MTTLRGSALGALQTMPERPADSLVTFRDLVARHP
jgi:hypothetical protein